MRGGGRATARMWPRITTWGRETVARRTLLFRDTANARPDPSCRRLGRGVTVGNWLKGGTLHRSDRLRNRRSGRGGSCWYTQGCSSCQRCVAEARSIQLLRPARLEKKNLPPLRSGVYFLFSRIRRRFVITPCRRPHGSLGNPPGRGYERVTHRTHRMAYTDRLLREENVSSHRSQPESGECPGASAGA